MQANSNKKLQDYESINMFQPIYFAEEIIEIMTVNAYRPYLEEKMIYEISYRY